MSFSQPIPPGNGTLPPESDMAASTEDGAPPLIFDWKHRPRTWWRLGFWLLLALAAHLGLFYLVSVRTPSPNRVMPMPAVVTLGGAGSGETPTPAAADALVRAAALEVPNPGFPSRYVPSYEGQKGTLKAWPPLPSPDAWPDVSGLRSGEMPSPVK